jgi:tetratricopeptide (TPR) repeat protein
MNSNSSLDPEELKFLAIRASRSKQADQALLYLKQAISAKPQDGELYYLLAAEHAQLGMIDRAADEMEHALLLAPGMHTARLQLGLLYLTQANVEASIRTLEPLFLLKEDNCYRLFSAGLVHLIHDRFPACRAALTQGIACNAQNDALNGDMQKILDALPPPEANQRLRTATSGCRLVDKTTLSASGGK